MALGNYDVPAWVTRAPRNWSKNQRSTMSGIRAAMEAAAANPVNAMGRNSLTPQMAQAMTNPLLGGQQAGQLALPAAGQSSQALSHLPVGRVGGAIPLGAAPEAAARSINMAGMGGQSLGRTAAQGAASGVDDALLAGARTAAGGAAAGAGGLGLGAARPGMRAAYSAARAGGAGVGQAAGAGLSGITAAGAGGLGLGAAGALLPQVWNDPNSAWDDAASGALTGAGIGMGVGSVVPGLGTAAGGLIGGGLGGLAGFLTAGDASKEAESLQKELTSQRSKLSNILQQSGASSDFVKQAETKLDLMAMNAQSEDQIAPMMDSLVQQLIPAIAGDMQQQVAERMRSANVAAMQAWMGPMMQDALNRQQYYADQSAGAASRTAGQFADPALRAAGQSLASRTSLNAANSATSQLQQLAATPGILGYYSGQNQMGAPNQDFNSLAGAQQIPAGSDPLQMLLQGY